MRKTKIVCTMGPSTDKPGILRQLMENGMNVARFNFSHGDYEEHKGRYDKVRALSKELDLPIACMLDTKGPEIRLGEFKNGVEKLTTGQKFTLTSRSVEGTNEICSVTYKELPHDVKPGGRIMLDDVRCGRAGRPAAPPLPGRPPRPGVRGGRTPGRTSRCPWRKRSAPPRRRGSRSSTEKHRQGGKKYAVSWYTPNNHDVD